LHRLISEDLAPPRRRNAKPGHTYKLRRYLDRQGHCIPTYMRRAGMLKRRHELVAGAAITLWSGKPVVSCPGDQLARRHPLRPPLSVLCRASFGVLRGPCSASCEPWWRCGWFGIRPDRRPGARSPDSAFLSLNGGPHEMVASIFLEPQTRDHLSGMDASCGDG